MAHPGSHGKKVVKWMCTCVVYRRVSRDDAATAAADSSSSAAGPDDDGDMTASTDSRVGFLPWQKLFLPGQWKKPVKPWQKN